MNDEFADSLVDSMVKCACVKSNGGKEENYVIVARGYVHNDHDDREPVCQINCLVENLRNSRMYLRVFLNKYLMCKVEKFLLIEDDGVTDK